MAWPISSVRPCSSRSVISTRFIPHSRTFSGSHIARENKAAQPSTPATDNISLGAPLVYISKSPDAYFNLSYEDWLLRNTPADRPLLFFYRNHRCIVIGRNQTPWRETRPQWLYGTSTPLIRRRSGGGAVYHDMGNTNFSIMLPRLMFTRNHGAELVARAVRERLGIAGCTANERNDVIIKHEGQDLKVSGSAYKIIQHRAYHHGTMLISSQLGKLGEALRSQSPMIMAKGVDSHRSPVTTLNLHRPSNDDPNSVIKHAHFVDAVTKEFEAVYASPSKPLETITIDEEDVKEPKVWEGVKELKSWEWTYGQTPEFSNMIQGEASLRFLVLRLTAKNALITAAEFEQVAPPSPDKYPSQVGMMETLEYMQQQLVGKRYGTLEGMDLEQDEPDEFPRLKYTSYQKLWSKIVHWLRLRM